MKATFSILFALLTMFCASCGGNIASVENSDTVMFSVSGLSSQADVDSVVAGVQALDGVGICEVWLDQGSAVIEYKPRVVSAEEIQVFINGLGFEATYPTE